MKRMTWDEYYMANAFLAALRSKDPATKVGACIVNQDKKIVGLGYNGFPIGCSDDEFPWSKNSEDPFHTKYLYVCHAEVNAILNKNSVDTKGCHIYVALFPCNECTKLIIQSRIKKVIYFSDKYADKPSVIASKKLLDAAGVEYVKFTSTTLNQRIDLNFCDINDNNENSEKPKYLCWTDYFMSIAVLASHRSNVPSAREGACIINAENKIVGIGYYGLPIGCDYDDFTCSSTLDRNLYFCHAELNAIANKNCESVKNCTIYVTQFPCCECAKILIQSGIKKIFYLNDENFESTDSKAACRMFDAVKIEYTRHKMLTNEVVIDFDAVNK
ncbi:Deoxycytidylate deaminase [Pseudolycoriella hygida]|uniref:Probable deoxycytidylate deaminase n=1 Tax=Pseudolycoriella hygida TaxID=35572 RepID=A0A9Q0NFU4_9DIPT|nr:Deoxycytidylate deaminase [Pseudolycoriella hygida]